MMATVIIIILLLIVIALLLNINHKLPPRDHVKEAVEKAVERDLRNKNL